MSDEEEWRPIPGYSNYEASSWGRIKSLSRYVRTRGNGQRLIPTTILRPGRYSPYGHVNVGVAPDGGRSRCVPVHILVCLAFHGEKPTPAHEVRHLGGDASDNRPENLRWGTRKENCADRAAHGNHRNGYMPERCRATSYIGPVCKPQMRKRRAA